MPLGTQRHGRGHLVTPPRALSQASSPTTLPTSYPQSRCRCYHRWCLTNHHRHCRYLLSLRSPNIVVTHKADMPMTLLLLGHVCPRSGLGRHVPLMSPLPIVCLALPPGGRQQALGQTRSAKNQPPDDDRRSGRGSDVAPARSASKTNAPEAESPRTCTQERRPQRGQHGWPVFAPEGPHPPATIGMRLPISSRRCAWRRQAAPMYDLQGS